MSLYHAQTGHHSRDSGKFRSYSLSGTGKAPGGKYRGWLYDFVTHQTGTSVRRTSYAVAIKDPAGNRVEYLRDYSSISQATQAARDWIDEKLSNVKPFARSRNLGVIPSLPKTQEK